MSSRRRGRWNNRSFVMLGRRMLKSPEWKRLGAASKLLYIYLKFHFNGTNNGEIKIPYSSLRGVRGLSSSSTISKAHKELNNESWVSTKNLGGLYRKINTYSLTGKYDEDISPKR
jgi:hypothetical protein